MDGYSIFELSVPKNWDNLPVGQINVRSRFGINILGVKNGKMEMNINPDTVLHFGQTMLVLGKTDNIQRMFGL